MGYYVVGRAEGERKLGFELAALSGDDVLRMAKRRAWGLEVPWRVKIVNRTGKRKEDVGRGENLTKKEKGHVGCGVEEADEVGGKKRPGKKRRIVLRERKKRLETLAKQTRKEMDAKEEAEREKRTRRNREKKVKRRLKEKAKKAGDRAEAVEDDSDASLVPVGADAAPN